MVPNMAKIPIMAPRMKNHMPESKTPSKTGRKLEITGRSLEGKSIPYRIRNNIVDTAFLVRG